jgi:DNA replication protein DnaC
MTSPRHEELLADLAELKLHRIAEMYQEVLNEAARKGSSMLEVLAVLIGEEVAVRRQRALERRLRRAHLPKRKTLAEYDFTFPQADSQADHLAAVRLRLRGLAWVCRVYWAYGHRQVASVGCVGPYRL